MHIYAYYIYVQYVYIYILSIWYVWLVYVWLVRNQFDDPNIPKSSNLVFVLIGYFVVSSALMRAFPTLSVL